MYEVISYSTFIDTIMYLSPFSKYMTSNFNDLDMRHFKVILGQRAWCQSIAHRWLSIWLSLSPTSYLSPFSRFDIKYIFPFEQRWRLILLPVWRLEIFRISTKNNRQRHLLALSALVASLVNIGVRLRSVQRLTRLVWHTHPLTDTHAQTRPPDR